MYARGSKQYRGYKISNASMYFKQRYISNNQLFVVLMSVNILYLNFYINLQIDFKFYQQLATVSHYGANEISKYFTHTTLSACESFVRQMFRYFSKLLYSTF